MFIRAGEGDIFVRVNLLFFAQIKQAFVEREGEDGLEDLVKEGLYLVAEAGEAVEGREGGREGRKEGEVLVSVSVDLLFFAEVEQAFVELEGEDGLQDLV